jgi:hypothetical protein
VPGDRKLSLVLALLAAGFGALLGYHSLREH